MLPPPGGAERGNRGLAAEGGAEHVDRQDVLPVLGRRRGQRLVDAHAGHVEEAVQRAVAADRRVDGAARVLLAGDVAPQRGDAGVQHDDRRPFLGEQPPRRLADSSPAPGDERDAAPHATSHRAALRRGARP